MSIFLNSTPGYTTYHHCDFAGIDGLQFAQQLFGVQITRLAPFQSQETTLNGHSCSVLRLCEGNFRIGWTGEPILAPPNQRVWVKSFSWLATLILPATLDLDWASFAIPKPPHRIVGLANHCAAPARIDGVAVLLWKHQLEQPVIELHMAQAHQSLIKTRLETALALKI
jgi:hypothetical protein